MTEIIRLHFDRIREMPTLALTVVKLSLIFSATTISCYTEILTLVRWTLD